MIDDTINGKEVNVVSFNVGIHLLNPKLSEEFFSLHNLRIRSIFITHFTGPLGYASNRKRRCEFESFSRLIKGRLFYCLITTPKGTENERHSVIYFFLFL